jgi:site-specific DNA recombinase
MGGIFCHMSSQLLPNWLLLSSVDTRIGKKRDRLESERQRAIDMAIKGVIGEEDARTRIAELKAQVMQAEVELASLDEVPQIIALYPATLDR